MNHVYWFTGGFVTCLALTFWWFHGDLKDRVDALRGRIAAKIRGWLA